MLVQVWYRSLNKLGSDFLKKILLSLCIFFGSYNFIGCGYSFDEHEKEEEIANINTSESISIIEEGSIGDDIGISRELASKIIALFYYNEEEINNIDININNELKDVKEEDWGYKYINICLEKGFFNIDNNEFNGDYYITLEEAQFIVDKLSPNYGNELVLTDVNKGKAISYELFIDIVKEGILSIDGTENLEDYGIYEHSEIVMEVNGYEIKFKDEILYCRGYDLTDYTNKEISFLKKGNEIIALLSVVNTTPIFENIYYNIDENEIEILGDMNYKFPYLNENNNVESSGFGNITIINGVAKVEEMEKISGVVHRVNNEGLYIEHLGWYNFNDNIKIYDENNFLIENPVFVVGTNVVDFYVVDNNIVGGKFNDYPMPYDIRILLGGEGYSNVYMSTENGENISIKDVNNNVVFESNKILLTPDLEFLNQGVLTIENNGSIYINFSESDNIENSTSYGGDIKIEVLGGKIHIIEIVNIEEYLLGVVPYEMPSSFGLSALEAQAICARSYAFNQFYSNTYGYLGAHVVDTVSSQVYKGKVTTNEAIEAVSNTEGLCLVNGDKVVVTYFYSTSSGFGARDMEVWSYDGNFQDEGKSYLVGKGHGIDENMPTNEEEWLEFWKDLEISGYDENSPWYRWKVYFTLEQLGEIVSKSLVTVANASSSKVRVKNSNGDFINEVPSDLGALEDIYIKKRGESGVVEIVEFKFSNKDVQVITENAIRKVLVPTKISIGDDIYIERKDGIDLKGQSMLPSGFFSISNDGSGIYIYGGGFGHGVGLSQYGAKELSDRGFSYEEILKIYYEGVEVAKVL